MRKSNGVNLFYVFLCVGLMFLTVVMAIRYENTLAYCHALEKRNANQYEQIKDYQLMIECYQNGTTDENY